MNPTEILKSALRVFDFLNGIIQEYGVYIFAVLAFLLILFLAWTLNGGLRRKLLKGKPMPHIPPLVVIQMGAPQKPPETFDPFPPLQDSQRCEREDRHLD